MLKKKSVLYGLCLALGTMLVTYIVFGLFFKNYYVWGGVQLAINLFYIFLAQIIKGRRIKKIRMTIFDRDTRLRTTINFKHPEMKQIQLTCYTLYWAAIFGIAFNIIGSKLFGMGVLPADFNPVDI